MENTKTIQNEEVVRHLYEEVLNKKNLELLQYDVSDDFVGSAGRKGYDAFAEPFRALISAAPDLEYKIEELISEGDKVVVKWKLQGTQTGPFQFQYTVPLAPTGKLFSNTGMAIFELENEKIIKAQILTDRLGFLQDLEVLPSDISSFIKKSGKESIRFIDKFIVPAKAKTSFLERMNHNRSFLKKLPGFVRDEAYEQTDDEGDLTLITIAVWENIDFVSKAKEAVQAEYKRIGFNLSEFLQQSNITLERGVFHEVFI